MDAVYGTQQRAKKLPVECGSLLHLLKVCSSMPLGVEGTCGLNTMPAGAYASLLNSCARIQIYQSEALMRMPADEGVTVDLGGVAKVSCLCCYEGHLPILIVATASAISSFHVRSCEMRRICGRTRFAAK